MSTHLSEADILERLRNIALISPTPEATDRAMMRVRNLLRTSPACGRYYSNRKTLWYVALPASIAASVLIAVTVFLTIGRASVTFADVANRILTASTMTFDQTMMLGDRRGPVTRFYIKSEGLIRWESVTDNGTVTSVDITNPVQGYHLTLLPISKRAYLTRCAPHSTTSPSGIPMALLPGYIDAAGRPLHSQGPQPPQMTTPEDFLAELKKLIAGKHAELGMAHLNKHRVVGFRLGEDAHALDIWADAATGDPVEMTKKVTLPDGKHGTISMSQFTINTPLQDTLFDTRPPKDYVVHERPSLWSRVTEDDLVQGLKALTELNKGIFPENLGFSNAMATKLTARDMEALDKIVDRVLLMHYFLQRLPAGSTWSYGGAGEHLGNNSQQILWYAMPGSRQCRVVFADFSIHDVPVAKVAGYKPPAATSQPGSDTTTSTFRATGFVVVQSATASSQTASTQPAAGTDGP